MKPRFLLLALFLLSLPALAGCVRDAPEAPAAAATAPAALTEAQQVRGIGPVEEVVLAEAVEGALATRGAEIYGMKCAACHKMDARYVGPPLGDVLARRDPAFVMNMMLNPEEMLARHPEVKALLAQYFTPMPNQSLTRDEARAVLEYLRREQRTPIP